jgi:uncharacterized protein (TIRG00374 family)
MTRRSQWQLLVPLVLLAVAIGLIWWRGPEWGVVRDAFAQVSWRWVAAAVALNLLSVVARSVAWYTAITQAMPPPHPRFRLVFSAFCVGLFGNVVLPARAGELARVAVLSRRMDQRNAAFATLLGSVFAHRVFDLFPAFGLVVWVLATAKIPHWAITSMLIALGIGMLLFAFAMLSARRHHRTTMDELGTLRTLLTQARFGLGVMRAPLPASVALLFQCIGWGCQLLAVWATMKAFEISAPIEAAGLVLVLMNVATIFPLWPGNVGLVQAAVALPLVRYGVPYGRGFAFGIGLQAIEASVGVGIGLVFLAREGLSYATLKRIQEDDESRDDEAREQASEPQREGARLPG